MRDMREKEFWSMLFAGAYYLLRNSLFAVVYDVGFRISAIRCKMRKVSKGLAYDVTGMDAGARRPIP